MKYRSTVPALVYLSTTLLMSLVINDLIFLSILLLVTLFRALVTGKLVSWTRYMRFSSAIALPILIINPLFNNAGKKVLLYGPILPVIGHVRVTVESLVGTSQIMIRLLITLSAFALLSLTVDRDALLRLLSRISTRSTFSIAVSARLFPVLSDDALRIMEAQKCRGARYDELNFFRKIKARIPLLNILLVNSLERAMEIAESMESRAFGTAKRSSIRVTAFDFESLLTIAFCLFALFSFICFVNSNLSTLRYLFAFLALFFMAIASIPGVEYEPID